jgi:hypothetical protein
MSPIFKSCIITLGLAVGVADYAFPQCFLCSDNSHNTLAGSSALGNTHSSNNTAVGFHALTGETSGYQNTAVGGGALQGVSIGYDNTAIGYQALSSAESTTSVNADEGITNTVAIGSYALASNTLGFNNTAFGSNALYSNISGYANAAQGYDALYANTSGIRNLAIGNGALYSNTTGSYNLGIGYNAGFYQTTGTDDIYIGSKGVAAESHVMRLGAQGTPGVVGSGVLSAFVAGVVNSTITGSAVYITSSGQLGVLASSERYKSEIEDMGASTDRLMQLRPVTFKLKNDPTRAKQFGLIAEEVAKVYPELVIRSEDGRINGVRYEEIVPMLLNVARQQRRTLAAQDERAKSQAARIEALYSQIEKANSRTQELEAQVAQLNEFKASMMSALERMRAEDPRLAQSGH